jgi:hypothetical protein
MARCDPSSETTAHALCPMFNFANIQMETLPCLSRSTPRFDPTKHRQTFLHPAMNVSSLRDNPCRWRPQYQAFRRTSDTPCAHYRAARASTAQIHAATGTQRAASERAARRCNHDCCLCVLQRSGMHSLQGAGCRGCGVATYGMRAQRGSRTQACRSASRVTSSDTRPSRPRVRTCTLTTERFRTLQHP